MASETNVRDLIAKNNAKKGGFSDKIVPIILGIIAISILTTIGILFTLITETITFFTRVSIVEFLFTKDWNPTGSDLNMVFGH